MQLQLAEQGGYDKRAFYYWSKVFSDQIESVEHYSDLKKTIGILVLDFNFDQLEGEEDYHNIVKPYIEKSKKQFSDLLELHFIELNKFKKDFKDLKTAIDRWTAFLNKAYAIDKENIPKELAEDSAVKKAVEKLDLMYMSKEEREIYEDERKARMNRIEELRTALEKGEKEGIEKIKIENAKNLLDVLDDDIISKTSDCLLKRLKN